MIGLTGRLNKRITELEIRTERVEIILRMARCSNGQPCVDPVGCADRMNEAISRSLTILGTGDNL